MTSEAQLFLGRSPEGDPVDLHLPMANRHGLVAGATGTGKTVTLQALAEGFSRAGVPVFMADVKGDLSGLAAAGAMNDKLARRFTQLQVEAPAFQARPTLLWDIYGKQGHPVRTTISDMGPMLLSSLLELNDTQSGVLYAGFRAADDEGLLLLDLKDLRALLTWMAQNSKALSERYGNISATSVAAIQRRLLVLEEEGGDQFFGEPALELKDMMQRDFSGQGVISILDATALMPRPRLYATFLLWMLAELFEQLPEVGDQDRPSLVFFFDEAHLLFDSAPRSLVDKIEQVVRLIRSKGVGIYFISQSPLDIPVDVLGQLGNRFQHALRAFTPKDQKAVRAAAQTFRARPGMDTETAITQLGVGEALISVLDPSGAPTLVQHTLICPPVSRLGPLAAEERQQVLQRSPLAGRYDTAVDRESAYELLKARADEAAKAAEEEAAEAEQASTESRRSERSGSRGDSLMLSLGKSAARAIGTQLGRQIIRGVLGSILGGRR